MSVRNEQTKQQNPNKATLDSDQKFHFTTSKKNITIIVKFK